jgi:hypothetical protein
MHWDHRVRRHRPGWAVAQISEMVVPGDDPVAFS